MRLCRRLVTRKKSGFPASTNHRVSTPTPRTRGTRPRNSSATTPPVAVELPGLRHAVTVAYDLGTKVSGPDPFAEGLWVQRR
jgi:hypothetical protein